MSAEEISGIPKKYALIGGGALALVAIFLLKSRRAPGASSGVGAALQLPGGVRMASTSGGSYGQSGDNGMMLGNLTNPAATPTPTTAATIPGGTFGLPGGSTAPASVPASLPASAYVSMAAGVGSPAPAPAPSPAPAPAPAPAPTPPAGTPPPAPWKPWPIETGGNPTP
jgi:hypothetical protein